MLPRTDDDLYCRGAATLVASWEAYAGGSAGAALKRLDGVSAAEFPSDPEHGVHNALLDRDPVQPSAQRPSTRWRRPTGCPACHRLRRHDDALRALCLLIGAIGGPGKRFDGFVES